jgi:membrane protease YdiL (CAAX protease family)
MPDMYFGILSNLGVVLLLVLILKAFSKVTINLTWLLATLLILFCYFLALFKGKEFISLDLLFTDLKWNWSGKIVAITLWALVLALLAAFKSDFKIKDAGFTLRQNEGSIKPALVVLTLFVALQIIVTLSLGNGPNFDFETLLYQALIPGLDEEPMFRGVLLFCFSLAVVSSRINFFGSPINIAGLLLVLLFGLVHGVMYIDGEWHFSAFRIVLTGSYGFILLWLRERTGSLVFPIVAHNMVNFVGQLV